MRKIFLISGLAVAAIALLAQSLSETYRDAADKLIDAALADQDGYAKLSYLCDRIGNRLSGSPGLEKAIAWAAEQMKRDGLENISTPHVKVPHWSRGSERAMIVEPVNRPLTMLGLGGSIGTGKNGLTAQVVPVGGFDELERAGRHGIEGKSVLF